jgi:hypothetical protein
VLTNQRIILPRELAAGPQFAALVQILLVPDSRFGGHSGSVGMTWGRVGIRGESFRISYMSIANTWIAGRSRFYDGPSADTFPLQIS